MKDAIQRFLQTRLGLELRRWPPPPPEHVSAPPLPDRLIRHCRLVEHRQALIRALAFHRDRLTVSEVGVAIGDFSAFLLDTLPVEAFHGIDLFRIHEKAWFWGKRTEDLLNGRTHLDFYQHRFRDDGRVHVHAGDSAEVLGQFEDETFDLVYVDARHDYDSASRDIELAGRKVRRDGVIVMNDYGFRAPRLRVPYGVPRATHEFMLANDWEMTCLALQPDGLYDVALRKVS